MRRIKEVMSATERLTPLLLDVTIAGLSTGQVLEEFLEGFPAALAFTSGCQRFKSLFPNFVEVRTLSARTLNLLKGTFITLCPYRIKGVPFECFSNIDKLSC